MLCGFMLIHHHSQAISPCNRIGHFLENKCRILNSLCVVSHICSPEFSLLKNKPWTDVYLLLFVFSMLSVFKIIYIFCKKNIDKIITRNIFTDMKQVTMWVSTLSMMQKPWRKLGNAWG